MTWPRIIEVVCWILLVIVLIIVFWPMISEFFWQESSTEISPSEGVVEAARVTPARRSYLPEDRDVFITQPGEQVALDVIDYKSFSRLMDNPQFVERYTEAIRLALEEKRARYDKKRRTLRADNKRVGMFDQDVRMSRIRKTQAFLDEVIAAIDSRAVELNVASVKRGLYNAFNDPERGVCSLVGREDVKDFIALQVYTFARNPRVFFTNFQNMAIYGGSGVGKTKLAEVIAFAYSECGILARNKIRCITKHEITTAYVNESPQLAREALNSTLEGVLFIDEAYDLCPGPVLMGIDHGRESITEIVNFLDKHVGLSVVIVAGYEKEMEERFMKANEGIPRRFPNILRLKVYEASQLTDILLGFVVRQAPDLSIECCTNFIYTLVARIYDQDPGVFDKQAGDMQNLSAHLVRAIYGSMRDWEVQEDREAVITTGFNLFLRDKGRGISVVKKLLT